MFAERYCYTPPAEHHALKERRENLLWPVYAWKVLYPDEFQRRGINLFQETLLGLIRAGIRDTDELAEAMALDARPLRAELDELPQLRTPAILHWDLSHFVVLKGARPVGEAAGKMIKELQDHVAKEIGPIAKPKDIRFGENLPKTRSGKIMRRLLRSLAKGETVAQDVSTLENPAILEQLRGHA